MGRLTKAQLRQNVHTEFNLNLDKLHEAQATGDVVAEWCAVSKVVYNCRNFPEYTTEVGPEQFSSYELLLERLAPLAEAELLERAWRTLPERQLTRWSDLTKTALTLARRLQAESDEQGLLLHVMESSETVFRDTARADLCKRIASWHASLDRKEDWSTRKKFDELRKLLTETHLQQSRLAGSSTSQTANLAATYLRTALAEQISEFYQLDDNRAAA